MSDQLLTDRAFINSIVGEGTCFKGELNLKGLLRIDGDFVGSINTDGKVLIGKNGRVQCSIFAGTVVIGGILKGDIISTEKVIVLSSGMILGNITAPRLVVEDGVIINGNYKIMEKDTSAEQREEKVITDTQIFTKDFSREQERVNGENKVGDKTEAGEYSPWKR